jgi:hypothetical protein
MTKKSFALFLVSLACDVLVYWNKIAPLNLKYIDNIIKIYFVYICIITFVYLFATLILGVVANSSRTTFSTNTSPEKIADVVKLLKIKAFKPIMVFSLIVDFGLSIVGCWWFFSVLMVKQIAFIFCMMFCRQVVEKLEKNPEIIQGLEEPKNKKRS